jgi:hypothetical protein
VDAGGGEPFGKDDKFLVRDDHFQGVSAPVIPNAFP